MSVFNGVVLPESINMTKTAITRAILIVAEKTAAGGTRRQIRKQRQRLFLNDLKPDLL